MTPPQPTADEIVQRGQMLYEEHIRPTVHSEDTGKFVVIDVETGPYELDESDITAVTRARLNHPRATFFIRRVGSAAAYRLGAHRPPLAS